MSLETTASQTIGPYLHIGLTWLVTDNLAHPGVECEKVSVEGLIFDGDGNPYDLTGKPAFSLCRCGGSVNKPFCDGTHTRIGFQAAEAAGKAPTPQAAEGVKAAATKPVPPAKLSFGSTVAPGMLTCGTPVSPP